MKRLIRKRRIVGGLAFALLLCLFFNGMKALASPVKYDENDSLSDSFLEGEKTSKENFDEQFVSCREVSIEEDGKQIITEAGYYAEDGLEVTDAYAKSDTEDVLKAAKEVSISYDTKTANVTFTPTKDLYYAFMVSVNGGSFSTIMTSAKVTWSGKTTWSIVDSLKESGTYVLQMIGYDNKEDMSYSRVNNAVEKSNQIQFTYVKPSVNLATSSKPIITSQEISNKKCIYVEWDNIKNAYKYTLYVYEDGQSRYNSTGKLPYSYEYVEPYGSLKKGHSYTFKVVALPEDVNQWNKSLASEESETAIIDSNGNITIVSVVNPIEIKLDYDSLTLQKGESRKLTATVLPQNAKDKSLTWSSSNTAVATVDGNGNVKAVSTGTANIIAKTTNNVTKVCPVKVIVSPQSVKLNYSSSAVYYGNTLSLTATLTPSDVTEKTITWTSSDSTVATVNNGTVKPTGKKAGVTTITAKTVNGLTATCKVTVYADNNPSNNFADIKYGDWKYNAAIAVYDKGYMTGKGTLGDRIIFSPDTDINRSQFVVSLYSMAGKPSVTYQQKFSDVKQDDWFALPVTWASENGIVAGNKDGSFGVNGKATREQLALMFYKFAVYNGYDVSVKASTSLDKFTDANKVDAWALTAVKWAVERGIISGKGNATDGYRIDPLKGATRIECAAMMNKFDEVYKNALKANVEDLEEPLALPMEEVEEVPVTDDEIEDVVDDEDKIEDEDVAPKDEDDIITNIKLTKD